MALRKSFCRNGHDLTGSSIHIGVQKSGRFCRTCANERMMRNDRRAKFLREFRAYPDPHLRIYHPQCGWGHGPRSEPDIMDYLKAEPYFSQRGEVVWISMAVPDITGMAQVALYPSKGKGKVIIPKVRMWVDQQTRIILPHPLPIWQANG